MVFFTFSQNDMKTKHEQRIRRIWSIITTRSTPDLWVKVFFYKTSSCYWRTRGHYRCAQFMGHGFYDNEWDFIKKNRKIHHCITLKYQQEATDFDIAFLMLHEFRHYLQWKKHGAYNMARKVNGRRKRPIQVEKDAEDWSKKRLNLLISQRKIKYKQNKDAFEHGYWMIRLILNQWKQWEFDKTSILKNHQ